MNPGNPVGAVATDHREVRHAHLPFRPLLDYAHAAQPIAVVAIAAADVVQETAVSLIDDV